MTSQSGETRNTRSVLRISTPVLPRMAIHPSCLHIDFDYADIQKRSMVSDPNVYRSVVARIASFLSLPVVPYLKSLIEKYGGDRFKSKIIEMTGEYKVLAWHMFDV